MMQELKSELDQIRQDIIAEKFLALQISSVVRSLYTVCHVKPYNIAVD